METAQQGGQRYAVRRVVQTSGHYTFRAWFGDSRDPVIRDEVMDEVERRGWLYEWHSKNLLAVSVESAHAQEVADYLQDRHMQQRLIYETGRSA